MGSMGTTTLPQPHPHPESLHLTEDLPDSTTNLPNPHHLPPHNQNGRLRQLQLLLLELLLRSGLLHLRQISKSFHQSTFGSIIRQHHNVIASPRRSPSSSQHGNHVNGLSARVTRHHGLQEWIEGQIDEDTRLKMEGKETSVTEMHFRFYLLLMNPEDFRS